MKLFRAIIVKETISGLYVEVEEREETGCKFGADLDIGKKKL